MPPPRYVSRALGDGGARYCLCIPGSRRGGGIPATHGAGEGGSWAGDAQVGLGRSGWMQWGISRGWSLGLKAGPERVLGEGLRGL